MAKRAKVRRNTWASWPRRNAKYSPGGAVKTFWEGGGRRWVGAAPAWEVPALAWGVTKRSTSRRGRSRSRKCTCEAQGLTQAHAPTQAHGSVSRQTQSTEAQKLKSQPPPPHQYVDVENVGGPRRGLVLADRRDDGHEAGGVGGVKQREGAAWGGGAGAGLRCCYWSGRFPGAGRTRLGWWGVCQGLPPLGGFASGRLRGAVGGSCPGLGRRSWVWAGWGCHDKTKDGLGASPSPRRHPRSPVHPKVGDLTT